MLVLSRKPGESIVIDDTIRIYFLGERGGRAKIGIEAPLDVPIQRSEIREMLREVPLASCVRARIAAQRHCPAGKDWLGSISEFHDGGYSTALDPIMKSADSRTTNISVAVSMRVRSPSSRHSPPSQNGS